MVKLQLIGTVIGTAMMKTIKVQVFRTVLHPLYKKVRVRYGQLQLSDSLALQYYRQRKNYLVHNDNTPIMIGDKVKIEECRKVSKRKGTTSSLSSVYSCSHRDASVPTARGREASVKVRRSRDRQGLHGSAAIGQGRGHRRGRGNLMIPGKK